MGTSFSRGWNASGTRQHKVGAGRYDLQKYDFIVMYGTDKTGQIATERDADGNVLHKQYAAQFKGMVTRGGKEYMEFEITGKPREFYRQLYGKEGWKKRVAGMDEDERRSFGRKKTFRLTPEEYRKYARQNEMYRRIQKKGEEKDEVYYERRNGEMVKRVAKARGTEFRIDDRLTSAAGSQATAARKGLPHRRKEGATGSTGRTNNTFKPDLEHSHEEAERHRKANITRTLADVSQKLTALREESNRALWWAS